MFEPYRTMEIANVHLVRVRTGDHESRIYAVHAEQKDALTKVLKAVPEGWSVTLLIERLSPEQIEALDLKPGEVRNITQ